MSARDHRSEIVLLVALVVLTALGLGVGVLVTQGGDDDSAQRSEAPSAAAGSTQTPSSSASPAPAALRVGDQAFVFACRLLPRDDVREIFGEFGADGQARQTYLARNVVAGEPVEPARRTGSGLTTSCFYTFGDNAGHTLGVDVSQFPAAAALTRRWKQLRADGTPVPRTKGQVLSLPATRSFALRTEAAIVEVRYSTFGDLARQRPMSSRERAWQAGRMRLVKEAVAEHLADGSAVTGPAAVTTGVVRDAGSPPYLAPCLLLTDTVFQATGGPPPGPVDVDSSYLSRDPYTDVPVSSCERRGTVDGVSTLAVLEVRVAADPAQASEVQAKHLDNRYPSGTKVREVATDAGPAYVVDLGGTQQTPWRSRAIQVVVGPYELHLNVLAGVTKKRPYGQWADVDDLVAAANELAGALGPAAAADVP